LHAAKERKLNKQNQKRQAIAEAKERVAKLRRQRDNIIETLGVKICKKPRLCPIREVDGKVDELRPYIMINLGEKRVKQYALMDSDADINSLSYESWDDMGKPALTPSKTTVATFAGDYNSVEGYLELNFLLKILMCTIDSM
jgi:hypothetical protein